MKLILISFLISNAFAKEVPIKSLGSDGIKKFIAETGVVIPRASISKDNSEGTSMIFQDHDAFEVFLVNVDNRPGDEYVLTFIHSGMENNSGVRSIHVKNGKTYRALDFNKLVPDAATFPENLAKPFLVNRDGVVVMRFLTAKVKGEIQEYVLTGETLKKFSK